MAVTRLGLFTSLLLVVAVEVAWLWGRDLWGLW